MATIPVECYVIECDTCHRWSPVLYRGVYPHGGGKLPHPDNWSPANWKYVPAVDQHMCPECQTKRQEASDANGA